MFQVTYYKTAFLLHAASGKLYRQILFHYDNAPKHMAKTVRTILQEFHWEILSHPPCSCDLAPSDFLAIKSWPCVLEHCHDQAEFDNGAFQMLHKVKKLFFNM